MVRVQMHVDDPGYFGGAELSAREIRFRAPDDVRFVAEDPDLVILQNCLQVPPKTRYDVPFIKIIHDLWPGGDPDFRRYVLREAKMLVFSSPQHVDWFPHPFTAPYTVLPPAIDLTAFRDAPHPRDRDVLWLANNFEGKGWHRAVDWVAAHRTSLAAYGAGTAGGLVSYHEVPELMGHFKRFLFLPTEVEPFGRTVSEAWASGLDLVVDEERIGAMWWIEHQPGDIERGAEMFWEVALA